MIKRRNALSRLTDAIKVRGLTARPFSFGRLVLSQSANQHSWQPVEAALLMVIPAGDGKGSELDQQYGVYIPQLETIIQAFDAFWPTTWGQASSNWTVERLSVLTSQYRYGRVPVSSEEVSSLLDKVEDWIKTDCDRPSLSAVTDQISAGAHGDWKTFIGLGYSYVLIRYFLLNTRIGSQPSRDELLRLARCAGSEEAKHTEAFLDWWESMPPTRQAIEV